MTPEQAIHAWRCVSISIDEAGIGAKDLDLLETLSKIIPSDHPADDEIISELRYFRLVFAEYERAEEIRLAEEAVDIWIDEP